MSHADYQTVIHVFQARDRIDMVQEVRKTTTQDLIRILKARLQQIIRRLQPFLVYRVSSPHISARHALVQENYIEK